jgi:hypothetical protein
MWLMGKVDINEKRTRTIGWETYDETPLVVTQLNKKNMMRMLLENGTDANDLLYGYKRAL